MEFSASLLSADFMKLGEQIKMVQDAGCKYLHIDVMDGHFVKNISMGICVVESLKTSLRKDVHLYLTNPQEFIDPFIDAGADSIIFQAKAYPHYYLMTQQIHKRGKLAGIGLEPETKIDQIEEILPFMDIVIILGVGAGFGGQKFIPSMEEKIKKLRKIKDDNGYSFEIQVDGGVTRDNYNEIASYGADTLVAGSMIFNEPNLEQLLSGNLQA